MKLIDLLSLIPDDYKIALLDHDDERNGDAVRVYVTPIKKEQEEAMRNE